MIATQYHQAMDRTLPAIRTQMRHQGRPALASFALTLLIASLAVSFVGKTAAAQAPEPRTPDFRLKDKERNPETPRPFGSNPEKKTPDAMPLPGDKGTKPQRKADPKDIGPKDAGPKDKDTADAGPDADPKKPKLSPPPQTAEEKARRLADHYAQLATAEDEETAKRHASVIERLWLQSGSDTVGLLLDRAAQAQKKKKPAIALKLLDQVTSLAPDYPEAFNQRAYFHFTEGNYDAAVGDLRRVIALDPNHYKALEGLAQIWRETGNKKGAYGVMKQLMDVYPHASGAKAIFEELKREVDGQGI